MLTIKRRKGKTNRVRLVIDCNVVISAGLSSNGVCRKVLLKALKNFEIIITNSILEEYRAVAKREKFSKVNHILFELINIILFSATKVEDQNIDDINLPDNNDLIYICAAINSRSQYLVTGNIKDFPNIIYECVKVVLPKEFLMRFIENPAKD
jgi:putative PIN family toxin of toxin-antitoxin system